MISGFMIVRDVLKQGYPFVEAIASALPFCSDFLISDGYSTDGTFEVLEKISAANPKVKVFREKWPEKGHVSVLADVTNNLRSRCSQPYIFMLQANEIVHEENATFIKALPAMFPNAETFSFPFIQFLDKYKLAEGFRLRLAKNLPQIVAKGDAWTLGTSDEYNRKKILKSLIRPRRFYHYLAKGVEFVHANPCYDYLSRAVYLPKPIFRYYALFPHNFLDKCQRHGEIFKMDLFTKSYEELKAHIETPDVFWRLGAEFLEYPKDNHYEKPFDTVQKQSHPFVIQEFISNPNAKQYYVREHLFEGLKKL